MTSLSNRLRRLEDLDEIRRLQQAYRQAIDNREFAGYALLFTDDGQWVGATGVETGPAAIQAMLERTQHHAVGDNFHVIANQVIALDGDTAAAESTFAVISRGTGDRPVLRMLGTYRDDVVRTSAGWRFQRRTASADLFATGEA